MVIVRESPRARISPDKSATQWPPKSPFQALLSSPSGRKKWQEQHSRSRERSTSPSPIKKPLASSRALQAIAGASGEEEDEDMDDLDDEETRAQLELARIEAKLKLDNIRRKKKLAACGEDGGSSVRASSRADSMAMSPRKGLRPAISQPNLRRTEVEVPLSPVRNRQAPTEHVSPARKRLGLHGPAKAVDISLKRARDGTQVKQSASTHQDAPRGKSFNERLRATVEQADDREAKYDRIERFRSKGFGTVDTTLGETRRRVETKNPGRAADGESKRPSSARGVPTSTARTTNEPPLPRSASVRSTQTSSQPRPIVNVLFRRPGDPLAIESHTEPSFSAPDNDDEHPSSYDPFSSLHLTKRHMPHPTLARAMQDKQIYTLPRLLKEVKSPHYDPPDCDSDFVVFAILASKSSPYDQKAARRTNDESTPQEDANAPRNKFMVLKLCDLKWEVDLFLFGTAFDRFWKLTSGTLLAILNPDVLPPSKNQNQHSGRFSLKLGSSEDSVMEVGVARDLGWCSSVRKDGQQCGEWVDKRSTEICEFHLNLFVERQRKGRMEVNGMWRAHGNGDGDPDARIKSRSREAGGGFNSRQMKQQKGVTQSREYGTLYSVPSGILPGKNSTASLLDAEHTDRLTSWTEHEKSRQRIAVSQKERDLQRQLGKLAASGNDSVGAEYMRTIKPPANSTSATRENDAVNGESGSRPFFEKPKAADLGLLGKVADTARLSPAKDRKRHFGLGAVSKVGGREAMGWGGAGRTGLGVQSKEGRLGSPEKGHTRLDMGIGAGATAGVLRPTALRARSQDGSLSPAKKRARFMLADKGFREPGRESGGQDLRLLADDAGVTTHANHDDVDDDDDGLDIV